MYGLLITFAILTSLVITEKNIGKAGLDKNIFWQAAFWAILFGVLGARLYHVIDYWEIYSTNPTAVLTIWHGGVGIFGALLAGGAALAIFLGRKGQDIKNWLDIIVIPLPLAQAIGRLGNYLNNELVPYVIYESLANLVLFLILLKLSRKATLPGTKLITYVIGYSTIRLLLEPLRANPWIIANLNVAQVISILLLLVSIALLIKWKPKQEK